MKAGNLFFLSKGLNYSFFVSPSPILTSKKVRFLENLHHSNILSGSDSDDLNLALPCISCVYSAIFAFVSLSVELVIIHTELAIVQIHRT